MVDTCLDRDNESNEILERIYNADSTIVQFLYATTAVGKSTLTDKIISLIDTNEIVPICIRTVPENNGNKYNEWEVFNQLFDEINAESKEINNSFINYETYISHDEIMNDYITKQYIEDCINKPKSILKHTIKMSIGKIGKLGPYEMIQYDSGLRGMHVKKNYLKNVFSTQRILLVIDNIQNIDNSSLKSILDVIYATRYKKHFLLFEYTITKNITEEQLIDLQNYIRRNDLKTERLELKQIPKEYIIDVVSHALNIIPSSYEYSNKILDFYDKHPNGNILQIIAHASNLNIGNECVAGEVDDEILKKLLLLSETSLLIRGIIIHNNGKLKKSILEKIIPKDITESDIKQSFCELTNEGFLDKKVTDTVTIYHASIIDSWKNSSARKIINSNIIALQRYESYYMNLIKYKGIAVTEQEVAEIPWLALLEIYKVKYPQKIGTLISHLRNGILTNISPDTAWIFLDAFIVKTKTEVKAYKCSYYEILDLCYEFELYQEGYECLKIMEDFFSLISEPRLLFYKMLYLSALDCHEENIHIFETYCDKFSCGSQEKLNLLIIVQASYKSLNKTEECISIYNHIQKNRSYRKYNEYGYFLRLTCMYLPRKKALRLIKKSYRFFTKRAELQQAGKSLITYSHFVSSLGNPNKALSYILQAEGLLINKQMRQHMFLVNKAVISMHMGIFDDSIWNFLDIAEMSARVSYDKLAIQICKLVWLIENDNCNNCEPILQKILEYTDLEPDKAIVSAAYYDVYYYYSLNGQKEIADKYKMQAQELEEWCPIVKAKFHNYIDKEYAFVLNKKWVLFYLEYWTYDLLY
nr:hypothetical protein [uncultured Faecalicatena sp.]